MSATVTVTDVDFEEIVTNAKIPVLVDFWAEWCGPCKMIAPILEELAHQYEGKLVVAKVDVDGNPEISAKYGIRNIPTSLIFKNGEIVNKQVGAAPKGKFEAMFIEAIA